MQSQEKILRPGDRLEVRALKSDGTVYRHWHTTVESSSANTLATIDPAGQRVEGPGGGWSMKHLRRTIYWLDRPYNLAEVYEPNGTLKQIYIHIASQARLTGDAIEYVDYELDVVKRPGEEPRIRDEDEFAEATVAYGYSEELCKICRDAVGRALELALSWRPGGMPHPNAARRFRKS